MESLTHTEYTAELTWADALKAEKSKDYFQNILQTINSERKAGKIVYPENSDIFNALALTPLNKVSVVIIGQDPYHGPGQAHGLCFSVKKGVPAPPSLMNIFKELQSDLGISIPAHGCLDSWAKQGVLLLNASLSVEKGKPQSHHHLGWHIFTDRIITILNESRSKLIFLLWGSSAQKKGAIIDESKHFVLKAPHPSPLSAHRGFLGCGHFSKANELLVSNGKPEIDWSL